MAPSSVACLGFEVTLALNLPSSSGPVFLPFAPSASCGPFGATLLPAHLAHDSGYKDPHHGRGLTVLHPLDGFSGILRSP